jgi:acetoin utilization deacetylase AcuC-like enzyme
MNNINAANCKKTVGVVRDVRFLDHIPGIGHIESPGRLEAIYERLDREDAIGLYQSIAPRMATKDELAWNHEKRYIERVEKTRYHDLTQLDPDTIASSGSWQAGCLAAGGVFSLLDAVFSGMVSNGLALVRPPGHHAERGESMGFCLFNNVALGAHYARKVMGCAKVLIVDWDIHHGNGTQWSFYDDPTVLYFSTHRYPYYPGSGAIDQIGRGEGRGFTVNCPLEPGAGDGEYAAVFRRLLLPVARAFAPDVVLVSAGFDIYKDDPLGGMKVTVKGFAYLARLLIDLAGETANGRIIFCLEGGYNNCGLAQGVYAVLRECSGKSILSSEDVKELDAFCPGPDVIDGAIEALKTYWPALGC